MLTIDNLILCSICLFFPIVIYINYTTYIKHVELKENEIFLEFALISSLILMLKYTSITPTTKAFLSIPIVIALYKNNLVTFFILSLIITTLIDNPIITILKYLIYLLIHFIFKKNFVKELILYILIELLFLIVITSNILEIFVTLISFIILNFILVNILLHGNKTIELSEVMKELEHEKLLRSSISKLTHELKNPIAVCQGYLEMINEKDQQKTLKYLNIVKNEINRSKTIIDEFSSYGKLKTVNREEMDISYLFEDIENLLNPLFKMNKSKLLIGYQEEIYLEGDYNKLKQVFINLLKNTLEAKQENLKLEVLVKIKATKNTVKIVVKDNGIGMSEETLKKVSEVFFTTKSNGTGLGLAYSKEVIELHKGTLKIKSKENIGTEIIVTLPKKKKSEDFNKRNY